MSERKINLEEIILDTYGCATKKEFLLTYDISIQMIKDIMKEAIKQALELAAENAKVTPCNCFIDEDRTFLSLRDGRYVIVDKQSILDTINQIE